MEEEGVLHGHLELLQPLLLQFSCLEEQLIALGTLVLNQEEHVSPLQGSRVENEGTCSEEGGTTRPLTLPLWGEKGQANYSLSAPRRAMHALPCKGLPRRSKYTFTNLKSHNTRTGVPKAKWRAQATLRLPSTEVPQLQPPSLTFLLSRSPEESSLTWKLCRFTKSLRS